MKSSISSGEEAVFDLSDRVKLRFTGADRLRFLNGQVSNDIRLAAETTSVHACVLTSKGRMDADVFISSATGALHVDADAALRGMLQERFERYLIADDVLIEDVTNGFAIFHLIGNAPPLLPNESKWIAAERFGAPGWDLRVKAARHDEILQQLSTRLPFCDHECAERFRIERGIPRWGFELTSEIIPIEANLEASCIDYEKGCYIGQEVISRMKMSGQTNKRLCGLVSITGAPLADGMRLTPFSEEKKDVGWISSAVRSETLGKSIALGFVKRGFNQVGTQLSARRAESTKDVEGIRVEITELPFV
ncbi:MAG: glycine cleavage T C-terminal barrel domain-containing protein [Verrucomicrobiota bacterium]